MNIQFHSQTIKPTPRFTWFRKIATITRERILRLSDDGLIPSLRYCFEYSSLEGRPWSVEAAIEAFCPQSKQLGPVLFLGTSFDKREAKGHHDQQSFICRAGQSFQ